MALVAQTITDRASKIIQDVTAVRWPLSELVQWLNDGQREIILHRPDSNPRMNLCSMVAGSRQTIAGIPGGFTPAKLLDVICVASGTYPSSVTRTSAVRLIEREILDAQTFDWHYANTSSTPKHFLFDPRDPLAFYVYPALGAAPTTKLEVLFSAYPSDVAAGTIGTDTLSVADVYGNALLDYILYRCYSKDSEYAGNPQRAQFHFQSFATSMKLELKGTIQMGPTLSGSVWNPNTPKVAGSYNQTPKG